MERISRFSSYEPEDDYEDLTEKEILGFIDSGLIGLSRTDYLKINKGDFDE